MLIHGIKPFKITIVLPIVLPGLEAAKNNRNPWAKSVWEEFFSPIPTCQSVSADSERCRTNTSSININAVRSRIDSPSININAVRSRTDLPSIKIIGVTTRIDLPAININAVVPSVLDTFANKLVSLQVI